MVFVNVWCKIRQHGSSECEIKEQFFIFHNEEELDDELSSLLQMKLGSWNEIISFGIIKKYTGKDIYISTKFVSEEVKKILDNYNEIIG